MYLWPSEFLKLVACEHVPLRWRRLFALAVYTYMRAGELAALEWGDVDLEHGQIHIHRSTDRVRKRGTGSTKSDQARHVPIEPAVLPLFKALFEQATGRHVFKMPSAGVLSTKLKHYLGVAGVTRADLFVTDATREAITFHDLRATGITWCAVRGDEPLRIMRARGTPTSRPRRSTSARQRTWRPGSEWCSRPCRRGSKITPRNRPGRFVGR